MKTKASLSATRRTKINKPQTTEPGVGTFTGPSGNHEVAIDGYCPIGNRAVLEGWPVGGLSPIAPFRQWSRVGICSQSGSDVSESTRVSVDPVPSQPERRVALPGEPVPVVGPAHPLDAPTVMALQRSAGNAAVARQIMRAKEHGPTATPQAEARPSTFSRIGPGAAGRLSLMASGFQGAGNRVDSRPIGPGRVDVGGPPSGDAAVEATNGLQAPAAGDSTHASDFFSPPTPPGAPNPPDGPSVSRAQYAQVALPTTIEVHARLAEAARTAAEGAQQATARYRIGDDHARESGADATAAQATGAAPTRGDKPAPPVDAETEAALDEVQGEEAPPVPAATRRRAERAIGTRLTEARLHEGPAAKAAAKGLRARAFSVGDHVGLAQGVSPETTEGQSLVAHELGHVAADGPLPGPDLTKAAPGPEEQVLAPTGALPEPELRTADAGAALEPGPEPAWPYRAAPPSKRGTEVHRAAEIDAHADNPGRFLDLVRGRAEQAERATDASTATHQATASTSLDTVAAGAQSSVESAHSGLIGTVDSRTAEVREQFASTKTDLHSRGAEAKTAVTDAATGSGDAAATTTSTGSQAVTQDLERRAAAIESHSQATRLSAIGEAEIGSTRAEASRVIASYQGHEKAADVTEAVRKTEGSIVGELHKGVDSAKADIEKGTGDVAGSARAAESKESAKVEDAGRSARTKLGEERDIAASGLDEKVAEGTAALDEAEGGAVTTLGQRRGETESELASVWGAAQAAISSAKGATQQMFESYRGRAKAVLTEWRTAAEAQLEEIQAAVGNLFAPDDAQPMLDEVGTVVAAADADLEAQTGELTGKHAAAHDGFSDVLRSGEAAGQKSLSREVGAGLGALGTGASAVASSIGRVVASLGPGFAQIVTQLSSTVNGLLRAVGSAGGKAEGEVAAKVAEGNATGGGELRTAGQKGREQVARAAEDATSSFSFMGGLTWLIEGLAEVLYAVTMAFINLCTGFLWGEAISEDYGGKWFAFAGDVIAGLVVFGDLRDIFKWGLWKPFIMGEGWTNENWLMIGLAVIGLIPLLGDIGKGVVKYGKTLTRAAAERLVKELGPTLAERLVKELGEKGAIKLVEDLGADVVRKLVQHVAPSTVKALVDELGPNLVKRWADHAPSLRRMLDGLGDDFYSLARELDPAVLVTIVDELGAKAVREVAADGGGAVVKDLLSKMDIGSLRKLLGPDFGWSRTKQCLVLGLSREQLLVLAELGGGVFDKCPERLIKPLADLGSLLPAAVLRRVLAKAGDAVVEIIENLEKDPGGNLLEAYDVLGVAVTDDLVAAFGGQERGALAFAAVVGEVGAQAVHEMLTKCADSAQFERLVALHGAMNLRTMLEAVEHANELE